MTIIIPETTPPPATDSGDVAAALAAGAALAEAEHAGEQATEAEQAAESAQATADLALDVASSASSDAWDARMAYDDLAAQLAELRAGPAVAESDRDDETDAELDAEPPAVVEADDKPAASETKKKSKGWWG